MSNPNFKLLLATTNEHKAGEYRQIFKNLPFELVSLTQVGITEEVPENGHSFQENAAIKAETYARLSNMVVLADDSGLEIDALNGEPGIYSARFAGVDASYEQKFALIYDRIAAFPVSSWTSRYRCVIAVSNGHDSTLFTEGVLEGLIAKPPRGTQGFGYDPIFYLPKYGKTAAEISADQKNAISHRGKAAQLASRILLDTLAKNPQFFKVAPASISMRLES